MTLNRIQHRRTFDTATGFPTPVRAGELVVNPVRRTLAVGDADGTTRDMTAVPLFDARAAYATGDVVMRLGVIYQATGAVTPGAFNPAQWVTITQKVADLQTTFDGLYAAIGHLHTGTYSPVGHNHDSAYAAISHNHDSQYASVSHNHDGRYAQLIGATFSGGVNFQSVVNFQGSYAATYGSLSVAGGWGGFVPSYPLHVRTGGMQIIMNESTGAQQVRYALVNPFRHVILYLEGDGSHTSIYDISGNRNMFKLPLNAGFPAEFTNPLTTNQYVRAAGAVQALGVGDFQLSGGVDDRYLMFDTNCYIQRIFSSNIMRFVKDGATRWQMGADGALLVNGVMSLDGSGHLAARGYTLGTLPSAAAFPGRIVTASGVFIEGIGVTTVLAWSNGSAWVTSVPFGI